MELLNYTTDIVCLCLRAMFSLTYLGRYIGPSYSLPSMYVPWFISPLVLVYYCFVFVVKVQMFKVQSQKINKQHYPYMRRPLPGPDALA
jgi:hypothetical protein